MHVGCHDQCNCKCISYTTVNVHYIIHKTSNIALTKSKEYKTLL